MRKLTAPEASGLRSAVEAEYESKRAAAQAHERFGSVAVFEHLVQSASRHIAALCDTLHSYGESAPVLAPAAETDHASLVEALEAAAARETRTAAVYDDVIQNTGNAELKEMLLPLWQSVSHLHLTAINDQLGIENRRTDTG